MNTIYLGIATMIGDHEIAQTYIQLIGLILSFLSAVAVIVTLNLQRISNDQQSKINELETKIKMKELTPIINLRTEIVDISRNIYNVIMDVSNSEAIVYMMGFKEHKSYLINDEDLFSSYGQIINTGTYQLKRIRFNRRILITTNELSRIDGNDNSLKLELIFTDSNMIQKYKTEYLISYTEDRPTTQHHSISRIY